MSEQSIPFVPGDAATNAFYKFANDSVFRAFIMSLEARAWMLLKISVETKEEVMFRSQGRASELMDISVAFQTFLSQLGRPAAENAVGGMEGYQ